MITLQHRAINTSRRRSRLYEWHFDLFEEEVLGKEVEDHGIGFIDLVRAREEYRCPLGPRPEILQVGQWVCACV